MRATGSRPGAERPWPLECRNPLIGARDVRKDFRTPLSTMTAFCPRMPWSSNRYNPFRETFPIAARVGSSVMGEEKRQDRLVHLPLEGMAVLVVVLALALEAVAHGLVKEDAGCFEREQGGAGIRVEHWRLAQREP